MFTSPPRFLQGGLFGWMTPKTSDTPAAQIRAAEERRGAAFFQGENRPFFKEKIECFVRQGTLLEGRDSAVWRARDRGVGRVFARDGTNSFSARACMLRPEISTELQAVSRTRAVGARRS